MPGQGKGGESKGVQVVGSAIWEEIGVSWLLVSIGNGISPPLALWFPKI